LTLAGVASNILDRQVEYQPLFQINPRQLKALDALQTARLDAYMVQVIGEALPDLLDSEPPEERRRQLAARVEQGCELVFEMGAHEEADVAVLVTLQLAHGLMQPKDQDKLREWVGDLIRRKGSSGQVMVALVESTLARLAPTQPLAKQVHGVLAQVRAGYR
jgi:hypothetical protein